MRTITLVFTAAALVWGVSLSAQPCHNQIRTNPDAPRNTACPYMENVFDWRISHFPSNSSLNPFEGKFKSPYYDGINHFLDFLAEDIFLSTYRDFEPEEGWELIGEYFNPEEPDDFVCFVMYNRFESFLRIFTTLPSIGLAVRSITANVEIKPGNGEGYSALLSPSGGISQALDQPSIPFTITSNLYNNTQVRFHYFDIPVEYDPCTCSLDDTYLSIQFGRTRYQNLLFFDRHSNDATPMAFVIGHSNRIFPERFLSSLGKIDATYGEGAGIHAFTVWSDMVMQHRNWRRENDQLRRTYERMEAFRKGLELALEQEDEGPVLRALLQTQKVEVLDTISNTGTQTLNDFLRVAQLWGAGIKKRVAPSGDYVYRLGSTSIAYEGIDLMGSVATDFYESRFMNRALPGSATANCDDPIRYPLYNEVLGRFAVLETPEAFQVGPAQVHRSPLSGLQFASLFLQFDPESFEYAFNPAAGILAGETEMWASLEFEIPSKGFQSADSLMDIRGNLLEHYRDDHVVLLSSPLLPLSCLGDYVSEIVLSCTNRDHQFEYPNFESMQVRLKLFVDYQFEGNQRALQLYTYPVNFKFNANYTHEHGAQTASPATPAYPESRQLGTTHFQEDQRIFAWSSVEIAGNLSTAPGVRVEIMAPIINLAEGIQMDSGIQLIHTFSPFTSCTPVNETSVEELAAFCQSTTYRARFASPQPEDEHPEEPTPEEVSLLRVYPNPTADQSILELVLPANTPASAYLSDVQGQRIHWVISPRDLPAGRHLFDVPMANLPAGMYLLTLQTSEGLHTVKLVRL